jgi:hypothetical protein
VSKALAGAQISLRKTLSDLKQAAYKAGCEISGLALGAAGRSENAKILSAFSFP